MTLNKQDLIIRLILKSQQQQISLESEWNGNLGWWFFDVDANQFYMNPLFLLTLGYEEEDLHNQIAMTDLYDLIHTDDQSILSDQLQLPIKNPTTVIESTYRIKDTKGHYRHHYINGKMDLESLESKNPFIIGTVYDVTSQYLSKRLQKKQAMPLHQRRQLDPLTKVLTQSYFIEHLQHTVTLAKAGQISFCLLVIDCDFFKNINEHFGREKGDKVLEDIGTILTKETRTTDYIGRTGGNKFHIILTDVDFKIGQAISERIRKSIASHMFVSGIRVTISGGLVAYTDQSYDDLFNRSLTLLKSSKASGHNKLSY